jgi:hypothetical protein
MKPIYCAQCGNELLATRKAVNRQIVDLIEPHECGEVKSPEEAIPGITPPVVVPRENKPVGSRLEKEFDKFEFVKSLNDLKTKPVNLETGDKRSKEHIKGDPVTSSAPTGLLDQLKNQQTTPPSTPMEDPDEPSEDNGTSA